MGNSKADLHAMCWGNAHLNGREMGDVESEPCKNKKKAFPSNQVIKAEIVHRVGTWGLLKGKECLLKCTNWSCPQRKEWMMANLVTGITDVAFLLSEEKPFATSSRGLTWKRAQPKFALAGLLWIHG